MSTNETTVQWPGQPVGGDLLATLGAQPAGATEEQYQTNLARILEAERNADVQAASVRIY